eukprot:CAMPEP_0114619368 /NCGR_PEP_ID=MMETSP0168-20121206/8179_1 /TAXON_ID=95228 ORGANISM="Vannella sp., Strain DIVA3 517/6/12" /NCGR_SAMPLE_ID=MMETSP0168 /ASSEMBLY_ACC=CAM_ASM_000044 /LENGTH=666 /DNA_ID=CAMNT_0001830537 /DNA_START=87 /DNA_END=2087 /DNA_ORIENTATION=+
MSTRGGATTTTTRRKMTSASLARLTRPTKSTTTAKENTANKRPTTAAAGTKRVRPSGTRTADPRAAKRSASSSTTGAPRARTTTTARTATGKTATTRTANGRPVKKGSTKRPAWDLKGRLQDLESTQGVMKDRIVVAEETVETLRKQLAEKSEVVSNLSGAKESLQGDISVYQAQVNEAQAAREKLMKMMDAMKEDHQQQLSSEEQRRRLLQIQHDNIEIQLREVSENLARMKGQNAQQALKITGLESKLKFTEGQLNDANELSEERKANIESLEATVEELRGTIEDLEERGRADEMERRKLHNSILELKGNIRVFCRVRPMLPGEEGSPDGYSFPDSTRQKRNITVALPSSSSAVGNSGNGKAYDFQFDNVFSPHSTQSEVFQEISALVQSALDGYHVCIFTYGQTGSGKTYTMEGPEQPTEETRGMIPRAVHQIFETAEALRSRGWSYEFLADYLEIYNESIRDLLSKSRNSNPKDFRIQHTKAKTTSVANLTYVPVTRPDQVHGLLYTASKNRAVAKTECNDRSSRSHSVFQLKITGKNEVTGEMAEGVLNLVDLAGSERLKESKSTGDRLKETQNINKSLSCLGDVIAALANKDSHIPYRNSKLTFLLQNSLGGNSKTLMFVNISPNSHDLNESINSLRFATKVNACDIGVARKGGRHDLSS